MNQWLNKENIATDSQMRKRMKYSNQKYPYQEESYQIIGICMEVHRILGKGFLEIVYKDALEYEFKTQNISYEREKKYEIESKKICESVAKRRRYRHRFTDERRNRIYVKSNNIY